MKQFEVLEKPKQEEVKQIQQEYKLIGTLTKNKGHILFEYNKTTKEILPAKFQQDKVINIDFKTEKTSRLNKSKVVINKDCFYLQALNKSNAIKRLRKLGFNI